MKDVRIIRDRQENPPVAELLYFVGNHGSTQYREIFPNQLEDMVSWMAGTQRFPIVPGAPLTGEDGRDTRHSIYKAVQSLYPGGLTQFLETFPRD